MQNPNEIENRYSFVSFEQNEGIHEEWNDETDRTENAVFKTSIRIQDNSVEEICANSSLPQRPEEGIVSLINKEELPRKIDKETDSFVSLLRNTPFEEGMYNEAYDKFEEIRAEYHEEFAEWVAKLCLNQIDNDEIIVKLLAIFADYEYEELAATQPWIIIANINNRSNAVKSAALNIIDSWRNEKALELLDHFDIPTTPWLKLKYVTIKNDLKNVLRPELERR